jgi:branched-chain amino acid transport system permease protein
MSGYLVSILVSGGIFALVVQGLNIHWGYTGLLNFGIVAFVAVGAYTFAISVEVFGWSIWLAGPLAMVTSGVVGLLVSLPAIRLRLDYLAIVTLAVGEITRHVLKSAPGVVSWSGGARGIRGYARGFYDIPDAIGLGFLTRQEFMLVAVWACVGVVSVLLAVLLRSPWGRVLQGIREDEDAMRALGKDVVSYKAQSFALGSALAGLGGVMFALNLGSITPDAFTPDISFYAWIILLIGGAGTLIGPVVGSVIFWMLFNATQFIPDNLLAAAESAYLRLILLGLAIILLVMFRPGGIFGKERVVTR